MFRADIRSGPKVVGEEILGKARVFRALAEYFQNIGDAEILGGEKFRLLETSVRLSNAAEKLAGGAADRLSG